MTTFLLKLLLLTLCLAPLQLKAESVFRFHLPSEPSSLAPNQLSNADVSFLFHSLYRGLYSYSKEKGLQPEGAESCKWSNNNLLLTCKLKSSHKWNHGEPITAHDYVRAWRELLSPRSKIIGSELLENVLNTKAILKSEKKPQDLGVTAIDDRTLKIEFIKKDPDFFYKLSLVILAPIKTENFPLRENGQTLVSNGPYEIVKWKIGSRITLRPNKYFHPESASARPLVEVLFIEEDLTALNLFESGELQFVRRIPAQSFAQYGKKPEFHEVDLARFDYFGFGPELDEKPQLRKALALGANYAELKKIMNSPGMPGCPNLQEKYFDRMPCIKFDLAEAKKALKTSQKSESPPARLKFTYSKLGGDSIVQMAEWLQGQWKKNLGLIVDLQPSEQGVFLATLRKQPPMIFRKGVGLDRPTCLAATEVFTNGNPENFLKINDPKYESLVATLAKQKSETQKKVHCRKAIEHLLAMNKIIPTGRFTHWMLASRKFTGWSINELYQLDLTHLRALP